MPERGRVRIVGLGFEHPTLRTAVHRHEPGPVLEFGTSPGDGSDVSAIPPALMDELDRSQHVYLTHDVILTANPRRRWPSTGIPVTRCFAPEAANEDDRLSAARVLEGVGVAVIVLGSFVVAAVTVRNGLRTRELRTWYTELRQGVGRSILLGLEILVGADIIRTVAEQPTLGSVAILAGIVLIRTFLSFTLEVELEGRWPWQQKHA